MKKLIILFLLIPVLGYSQLKKEEKALVKAVEKRQAAALELLKKAVNINSGTMNFKGVQKVGSLFMEELKALGFEVRWSSGDAFNRAGHLIAVHKGSGKKILLIGHLDTVFEEDSPFQEYKMLNDSIMHGPGASDMKGGDVVIILAMQALHDAGLLKDLSIEIVMTGDEELNGEPIELSKKDIVDAAIRADIALGYEDGDGSPYTAIVARRGYIDWELIVKGNTSHSSQIFTEETGSGAIYEASRILDQFYQSLSKMENLTFNPGVIIGGNKIAFDSTNNTGSAFGKNNIVAGDVMVRGDLRSVSGVQLNEAKKIMESIITKNYPHTSAALKFGEGSYPPLSWKEGNTKLLNIYSKVSTDLGYSAITPVNPRNAGAADISFAGDHVEMAMDAIGIAGGKGHTVNEYANINYLPIEAKRSALLIYRLGKQK